MMFKMLYLLFMLLPLQFLNAQTSQGTFWGFSVNVDNMLEKNNSKFAYQMLNPDLNLFLGYNFSNSFQADFYAGYATFSDNWNGPSAGISSRYLVINKFFILSGLEYNYISGGTNAGGNFIPTYYKRNFIFINLGSGYFLTKKLYINFLYSWPLNRNKVYAEGINWVNSIESIEQYKLVSKLRIGFGFNFSF